MVTVLAVCVCSDFSWLGSQILGRIFLDRLVVAHRKITAKGASRERQVVLKDAVLASTGNFFKSTVLTFFFFFIFVN